ncbi:MFS general substrate transporter [Hyphopichia burtonii NRRL Y-1933]|uniref:MFS general substrate transporter n=1 Tax=Hyphopichia burtonii NRRL Y-1933 TaxID=984485 RepID=A0A1E4RGS0_9ASCO|nr:MFS general substrate transporter [Hyphopichia burtonii NRRL Y-1933]ODV66450.1 MFS general substrate transporter [Hyphopichia burtonii NRRL Y-1933]
MSNHSISSEIDPLIPESHSNYDSVDDGQPFHTKDRDVAQLNPDYAANIGHAATDFYEAVIEEEHQDSNIEQDEDVVWLQEQRSMNKTMHWFKRPSIFMVGVLVFSAAFASGSGESTRQMLSLKLACNYLARSNPNGHCDPRNAQVLVSNLQMFYSIFGGLTMMFASGKISPLSDIYGRRLFLRLSILALLLARFSRFLLMFNFPYLRFNLMVLTEVLGNLCGGLITLISITNCYISDVVEPHQRIYCLGLNIAFLFIGYSTGPLVGNFLLKLADLYRPGKQHQGSTQSLFETDLSINRNEFVPLQFEIFIFVLAALFTLFILPESRSSKARRKSRTLSRSLSRSLINASASQESNSMGTYLWSFLNTINFLKPIRLLFYPSGVVNPSNYHRINRDRTVVIILSFCECFLTGLGITLQEINILYGVYVFGWTSKDIGHLLAIACATRAFTLMILSPIITRRFLQGYMGFRTLKNQFDMIDFTMAFCAFILEAIGLTCMAMAPQTRFFFGSLLFTSFGALASPALNSSTIKFYPESKIGEVFGGLSLLKNVFALLGPTVFLTIYKKSVLSWNIPYVSFLVGASLMTLMAILLVFAKRLLRLDKNLDPMILTRSNSVASLQSLMDGSPTTQSNDTNRPKIKGSRSGSFSKSPANNTAHAKSVRRSSSFNQTGFSR